MPRLSRKLVLGAALLGAAAAAAHADELVFNTDYSDPGPKAAIAAGVKGFEAAYPNIHVKVNTFDHEGYKSAIFNFLSADPPDLATWYAANRMAPFVKDGLFTDVTPLWQKDGWNQAFASSASSMTINGRKWGLPLTYYQWGIYYRKDLFHKLGLQPPKTWKELLSDCATLKAHGITPFTIGTKAPWPAAGWFDYLDLRVNGYAFHMKLMAGKVSYTDPRVEKVFDYWDQLTKPGYFIPNSASYAWQEAVPLLVKGKAAMYLMGNFAVDVMKSAGLKESQIGFVPFPVINPKVPDAEEAPTDIVFIPAHAKHKADAEKFLAYLARPDVQSKMNAILGQLPTNKNAKLPDDPFLKAGFKLLSNAKDLSQFYDRDAPAQMAKAGLDGFQHYLMNPSDRQDILQHLDQVEKQVYSQ